MFGVRYACPMRAPLIPIALLLCSCKPEEEGGGRFNHEDDTAVDTGDSGGEDTDTGPEPDTRPPSVADPDGGGDDTFDATWVRCEGDAATTTWTFHAELVYTADEVNVDVALGGQEYEQWYLATGGDHLVWEVTVPEGISDHRCDEVIDLRWIAIGWDVWETETWSQYTPP